MKEKLEALRALVEKETNERLFKEYPNYPQVHICQVKPGNKYAKVDVGPKCNMSGKYMVDMTTGDIWGIKGYGQVHKGHYYGNLDTINDYYWGGYTAYKKN